MRKRARIASPALLLAALTGPAGAAGLVDAYQAARLNDPTFRAARFDRDAGLQAVPIARAGLLPTVSAAASRLSTRGERSSTLGNVHTPLDYRYEQDTLSLRQPIINYDAWLRYRQAEAQVSFSEATFGQQEGELAVRLVGAYFDVLLAREVLALSEAEVAAYDEQRRNAQRRMQGGEGTRTEEAESEARLRIAEASRLEARSRLDVAVRALEDLTRKPAAPTLGLGADFAPRPLTPARLDDWLELARAKSPELQAQRYRLASAEYDVERGRANHLPRVDFVASATNSSNESLSTLNQKSSTHSYGFELNLPLFAGGRVVAATDQAVASRERAQSELEAAIDRVLLEVRRQYLASQSGIDKAAAYARAVEASEVALIGNRKGLQAGLRTNVDVLDAQRRVFESRRDLAQARYELLLSQIKLKAAAGTLAETDIAEIDAQLAHAGRSALIALPEREIALQASAPRREVGEPGLILDSVLSRARTQAD